MASKRKKRKPRKYNPMAQSLALGVFKSRVKKSRKTYKRKPRTKGDE